MKIQQSLNQNAVIVRDCHNKEFFLIGKGIGFNKKKGDVVEKTKSMRMIPLIMTEREEKILALAEDISSDLLLMVEEVLKGAEDILGTKLDTKLIFALATHIYYSLKRKKSEDVVVLPFNYELKYIFPTEYKAAKWSIDFIREQYDLELFDAEIVFFTFHFVNALQTRSAGKSVIEIGQILSDIIQVVENESQINFDQNTLHFSRFLIHVRYLLMRDSLIRTGKRNEFKNIVASLVAEFPYAYKITKKIEELLVSKHKISYHEEETLYLLIHIQRLLDSAGLDEYGE